MNLNEVLERHQAWLYGGRGGVRANLTGANLTGANLTGAVGVIDLGLRSDGHRFVLVRQPDGPPMLKAGCRWFTLAEARGHWMFTRIGTRLGNESLDLCDHAEREAKAVGWCS